MDENSAAMANEALSGSKRDPSRTIDFSLVANILCALVPRPKSVIPSRDISVEEATNTLTEEGEA